MEVMRRGKIRKAMNQELDKKTLGVILYFISRLNGVLGKTHLQKLLFLSDLFSVKKLKEPITALEFRRYKHGPFAQTVDAYTTDLVKRGLVEAREFPLTSNPDKTYTRYHLKKLTPIKKDFLISLIGVDKLMVVDEVADSYGNLSLQNLLDFIYGLEIVKDAKRDSLLDLAKTDNPDTKDEGELDDLPF